MAPELPKSAPSQSSEQAKIGKEFDEKLDYTEDTKAKLAQIEASSATPEQKAAAQERLKALLANTDQRLNKATDQAHQKIQTNFEK